MIIELDHRLMTDKNTAHEHIRQRFGFPEYYGRNLDALYDLLTDISADTVIITCCADQICEQLGDYGVRLLETIHQAVQENPHLSLEIC